MSARWKWARTPISPSGRNRRSIPALFASRRGSTGKNISISCRRPTAPPRSRRNAPRCWTRPRNSPSLANPMPVEAATAPHFSSSRSNINTTASRAIAKMKINRSLAISAASRFFPRPSTGRGFKGEGWFLLRIGWLVTSLAISFFISARASAETIYLHNAIVHTIANGTITNGGVLINGSKIEMVTDGKSRERIISDKSIDLKGAHVYPGLIALDSALGLGEIEAVRATQDTTESGEGYTPDVRSWIAVNPDSELIPVSRANGITHAEPVPQG